MFTPPDLLLTHTTLELDKQLFTARFDLSSEFILSSIFVDPSAVT
jgi:hypothetical protein